MRRVSVRLVLLVVAAGSAGVGYWYGLRSASQTGRGSAPNRPPTGPAMSPVVATSEPVRRAFALKLPWTGQVQPQASVELVAQEPGRIVAIEVADQAPVTAGTVLFRLGGPRVQAAQSELRIRIESVEKRLTLAKETVDRLGQSVREQLATRDQLAAAQEAQVKLEADLADARRLLQNLGAQSRIATSTQGVFTNRRVSVGQEVEAGQVLGEITDVGKLRIEARLFPPADVELLGQAAVVRVTDGKTVSGKVVSVLPKGSGSGAVEVWIEGTEIDRQLRAGQTVSGELTVGMQHGGLSVPQSALVYDAQEQAFVFVEQDGKYVRRDVRLGLVEDGWVEILSGIEPGEPVVTQGAYELFYRDFSRQFQVED